MSVNSNTDSVLIIEKRAIRKMLVEHQKNCQHSSTEKISQTYGTETNRRRIGRVKWRRSISAITRDGCYYNQVPLKEEARKLTTINTHRGLYQWNRLPYGVASSPAIFQEIMDKVLQGLPAVVWYLDDILVTGTTDAEHIRNVNEVLMRLEKYGLRVRNASDNSSKSARKNGNPTPWIALGNRQNEGLG